MFQNSHLMDQKLIKATQEMVIQRTNTNQGTETFQENDKTMELGSNEEWKELKESHN